MAAYKKSVRRVIGDYIKPDSTLTTMKRIHTEFTGEKRDFTRWDGAETTYLKMDWNGEDYRRFLELAREYVEGDTEEMSEAYFDITEPEDLSVDEVVSELSKKDLADMADLDAEEGFTYRILDDGTVEGTYHYATVSVEITAEPELKRQPNPKLVNFSIDPEQRLLIVSSTYPPYVQKLQSVVNGHTDMEVAICGNVTILPNQADDRVISFINSCRDEEDMIDHE